MPDVRRPVPMNLAELRPRLTKIDGRWCGLIDAARYQLFECPLSIELISTGEIDDEQCRVADRVLTNLDQCLAECDRLLQTDPTAQHIRDSRTTVAPSVVIPSPDDNDDSTCDWYVLIRHPEHPVFGLHVEFHDLTAVDIWGAC